MSLLTSLVSYWKLDEASGNALDAHGSNDLTDTNTVGTATGKINGGRDFEVSAAEYFSKASNADLSVANEDFTWAGWFQLESKAARMFALGKVTGGGQTEYWLDYDASGDRLRFAVGNGATAGVVTANNLGSPSTATWYYVVAWHDATANTVNIQVNDGTADSVSFSDGAANLGGNFTLGYSGSFAGGSYWDGLIDEVGFWKRVLTSGERTSLYNSGSGLAYSGFAGGTTINVTVATAAASGYAATVDINRTITASLATAAASGYQATVSNSLDTTINVGLATAAASGYQATVDANRTITASLATAAASGFQATVSNTNDTTINVSVATAAASGYAASLDINRTISVGLGTAQALGYSVTVTAGVDSVSLILKILANRQELNPATGTFTLYDNDGTTVLYTTNAWADAAGTVPYSGGALRRIDALF